MTISTIPDRICSRFCLSLAILAILSACAAEEPRDKPTIDVRDIDVLSPGVITIVQLSGQVDLAKDPRIVCEKRAPVGSNIPKTVCMTRDERDLMEHQAERELALMQQEWERKYSVYKN